MRLGHAVRLVIVVTIILLMAGCGQVGGANLPTPGITIPTLDTRPSPTPWLLEGPAADPTQPIGKATALCIESKTAEGFPGLPCRLEARLSPGLTLEEVQALLAEEAVLIGSEQFSMVDLNADGNNDYILSLPDPSSRLNPPSGVLTVYLCEAEACRLAWKAASMEGTSAPAFLELEDLNNDQVMDFIVGFSTCGAHTCSTQLAVYNWNGAAFENKLDGSSGDLPNPKVEIRPRGGNPAIWVTGQGIGSVGAGVQRSITRIWSYSPQIGRWQIAAEEKSPAVYRIHALQDAEDYFHAGQLDRAQPFFERIAINQPPYQDFENAAEEQDYINAYARLRLVMIAVMQKENGLAERWLAVLQEMAVNSPVNRAYLNAARGFAENWIEKSPEETCELLALWGRQNSDLLAQLGSRRFGYANREFTPEGLCP